MSRKNDLIQTILRRAKLHHNNSRGSHGWDHVTRVVENCKLLGPEEGCDMDILLPAALLHDIGRDVCDSENGKCCHAKVGAELARVILVKEGVDSKKAEAIVHCVAAHRFRDGVIPQSIEAQTLFDADKLDSIGAVGIARAFLFAGEIGARLHDPNVDLAAAEEYSVDDTAYREYLSKLKHVYDRIITDAGRKLARERNEIMKDFFNRLNQEFMGAA